MRVEKVCNIFDFYLHYKAKNDFKQKIYYKYSHNWLHVLTVIWRL